MKVGHEYDRFREKVGPVLQSKLEEFSCSGLLQPLQNRICGIF